MAKLNNDSKQPNLPVNTHLLAVRECAQTLRLGRSTLYRLMDEGKIKYITIASRRLIPVSFIEAFIASLVKR